MSPTGSVWLAVTLKDRHDHAFRACVQALSPGAPCLRLYPNGYAAELEREWAVLAVAPADDLLHAVRRLPYVAHANERLRHDAPNGSELRTLLNDDVAIYALLYEIVGRMRGPYRVDHHQVANSLRAAVNAISRVPPGTAPSLAEPFGEMHIAGPDPRRRDMETEELMSEHAALVRLISALQRRQATVEGALGAIFLLDHC